MSSPLRTLAAIVDVRARVRAVAGRLARLGTDAFVAALDELARDAARGATTSDVDAMLACALWLLEDEAGDDAGRSTTIDDELLPAARRSPSHAVVAALFDDGGGEPAHKALARKGRLFDHGGPNRVLRYGRLFHPEEDHSPEAIERQVQYIEQLKNDDKHNIAASPAGAGANWFLEQVQARIRAELNEPEAPAYWEQHPLPADHVARQLERLAMRPDADSIALVLADRATRVKTVVRIAARRPTTPAILNELVSHTRWMSQPDVRRAIIENPFTPVRVALLLLPTCRALFSRIAKSKSDVHPRVRGLASMLLSLPSALPT